MKHEKVAQRHQVKVRFDDDDMDFYFIMALAHGGAGGATIGECFHTAAQITEKDPQSWVRAWTALGERLEVAANAHKLAGRRRSARATFLRAYTAFRTATVCIRVLDPSFRETWARARACFRQAAQLSDPVLESLMIPYRTFGLPAYFIPGGDDARRRPTLIFTSGGEAFAEDGYFWVGAAGAERGYNVLAVELPAHMGARLLNPDMTMRTPAEFVDEPLRAVVDYALTRADVDPERLAIIGFSAGGVFASRAAMGDKRIKALIADSPIKDMARLFTEEFPPALRHAPAIVGDFFVKIATRQNALAAIVLERSCWQVGAKSVSEFLEGIRPLTIEPDLIACPTLCLASAGEGRGFIDQAREVYEELRVPKRLHVFSIEEGADAHCQVNNLAAMQALVFDWLDEVLCSGLQ